VQRIYTLDEKDMQARFFGIRKNFFREDMEGMFQVDYIKNLSIVAVTGEVGFEKIIGLGEYTLEQGTVAEIAFSTSRQWQHRGIATILLEKITEAARENGFTGLIAYTHSNNAGMIKLFNKLPYKVETILEGGLLVLKCHFDKKL
jgi:ribosomal protein S18 acetylase RimI-like enzyme